MDFKGYRATNRISQENVAKLLKITQSAYSKKESNPDSFKPSELKNIALSYKINIDELYMMLGI
ncbi:helix-turn-helix domain-containing protein [Erysipelothrix anatis]|uniref:helix-turn-helix domain-containing protein n=1 Tax=Erysipelothrix anatis TaxID=2683713 RepID=UPI00135AA33C|nr:helix-turn-helix transcriptional regulator [Erysipelothrix anatis]